MPGFQTKLTGEVEAARNRAVIDARGQALKKALVTIQPEHLHIALQALGIPMPYPKGGPYAAQHMGTEWPWEPTPPAPQGTEKLLSDPEAPDKDPDMWLQQMADAGAPGLDWATSQSASEVQGQSELAGQMLKAEETDRAIKRAATVNQLNQFLQGMGGMPPNAR